jgi:hypothetical protein
VSEIGHQLEEEISSFSLLVRVVLSLLSVTRMFLELGDAHRATFLAFLEHDYEMKVDSRVFKQQLTHLIDMLPPERISDLRITMESMLINDSSGLIKK